MLQNFNSVKRVMIFINNPNNDIAFLFEPCKNVTPSGFYLQRRRGEKKSVEAESAYS